LKPISLKDANAFVTLLHRHHKRTAGHKFSISVWDGEVVRGVCIVGRPVARLLDDGWTLEVNRCCTDGVKNGCSMLYGAARRSAKAMGYKKIITYTLPSEGGVSLRASGWTDDGAAGGGNWNHGSRRRKDSLMQEVKTRWMANL